MAPTWVLVILCFAGLYDVRVENAPLALRSINLAILALAALVLLSRRTDTRLIAWPIVLLWGIFIPYSLLLWISYGDEGVVSRMFYLAVFHVGLAWLVGLACGSRAEMLRIWLYTVSLQAVFLIASFQLPPTHDFIDQVFVNSPYFEGTYSAGRAIGLTTNAGAALSVIQATGVFAGLLLLRTRTGRQSTLTIARHRVRVVPVLTVLCGLSTVFTGRTGLLLSLALLVLLPPPFWSAATYRLATLGVLLTWAIIFRPTTVSSLNGFDQDSWLTWVGEAFTKPFDTIVYVWTRQAIPSFGPEGLFGTGLVSSTETGANPSGHDSGFIQTYFGYGLIMAVAIYVSYLLLLRFGLRASTVPNATLLAVLLVALDLKEPFLFKGGIVPFVVALYSATLFSRRSHERSDRMCRPSRLNVESYEQPPVSTATHRTSAPQVDVGTVPTQPASPQRDGVRNDRPIATLGSAG